MDTFLTIFKVTSRIVQWDRLLFLPSCGCSRSLLRVLLTAYFSFLTSFLLCLPISANASNITLTSNTDTATAGYFQLSWQAEQTTGHFVLQESNSDDFTTAKILYSGADLATVISGKPDNIYYYRVSEQQNQNNLSNTVKVTVAHHPLRNAFAFFSVGAIVFVATLFLIFRGTRQDK
jgi:hypothetical protein